MPTRENSTSGGLGEGEAALAIQGYFARRHTPVIDSLQLLAQLTVAVTIGEAGMTVARTLLKFMGLGLLVGLDLLRPSRAEYRMPARWLTR